MQILVLFLWFFLWLVLFHLMLIMQYTKFNTKQYINSLFATGNYKLYFIPKIFIVV